MATDLTGLQVRNTYQSLLKIGDNSILTGAPDVISDGFGNQSPLYLTTSQVSIGAIPAAGYDLTVNSGIRTGSIDILGAATAQSLQFTGGGGTQGTMSWNTDEETVDLIQNGATLQLGQEIHVHVKNQSGSTINNGTPVYVTGTLGASGRLTVAPMIADGSIPAKFFLGVTTEDIPNGEDGKVTTFGKVRGLNTTAYTEGQTLYVSSTTAGFWQTTPPISPALDLEAAIVINVQANNGTIFVRAQQGQYLGMLHDVYINGVSDGDLLVYDSVNTRWKNESISAITNINLDTVTDNGNTTTNSITVGDINAGNVTLTGYLRGAANFVIDPAAHGDDTGTVQILGNLRVDGTTTTINSTTVTIADKNIVLAEGSATAADANGAGITIDGANANMTYNSTTDRFVFNKDIQTNLVGNVTGDLTGNADTASTLETPRNIAVDGDVTGNADFDGSANITITTTVANDSHTHDTRYYTKTQSDDRFVNVTGDTITGDIVFSNNDVTRLIRSSVNGGAIGLVGNENSAQNPNRGLLLGGVDNNGVFSWAAQILNNSSFDLLSGDYKVQGISVIDSSRQATFTNATVGGTVSSNNFNTTGGSYNVDGTAVITSTGKFITNEIEGGTLNINGTTQINFRANGDLKAYVDATGFNVVGGLNLGGVDGISLTDEDSTIDSFFHANVNYDDGLYQVTSDARYGADYIQVDGNDTRTNTAFTIAPKELSTVNPRLYLGGNNSITAPNTLIDWQQIVLNAENVIQNVTSSSINGALFVSGNTTANSFIKSGGTASQFLKADGSIDSSTYLTAETDTLQSVTDRGATTNVQIVISKENVINTTTPGTGTGFGLHFGGQSTADYASGITFNGGTTGTTAQAGIYVQGSGAYGTKMYIATTDSYAVGAKTAISIDHNGKANFERQNPTVFGNGVWHSGNDGSGSGLDADLVDGLQGSQFVRSDTNDEKTGWLKVFSTIGANDNVRTGIVHYDTTSMAEGVGGQMVLGYKYTSGGDFTEGAILKMYKENSVSGEYGSGLKIQVRNHAEDLATKVRLSPSGHMLIGGDKNPDGTLEVFQEAVGSAGFWVDANATNRSRFETIVFENYTRLQSYGMGTSLGVLSINPLGNNVAIGSTSAPTKLYVGGVIRTPEQIDVHQNTGAFRFYDGSTFYGGIGGQAWSGIGATDDIGFYLNTGTDFHIGKLSSIFATFDSANARVGIGQSSPSSKLTIREAIDRDMNTSGTGQFEIQGAGYTFGIAMGDSTTALYHNSASRSLTLGTNEQSRITILGGGNVGVNNPNPTYKFDVVSTTVAGSFTAGDGGYTALRFDGDGGATIGSITTNAGYILIGSQNAPGTGSNGEIRISPYAGHVLYLDSARNVGIGQTPSAWNLGRVLELGGDNAAVAFGGTTGILGIVNGYFDGSNYRRKFNGTVASFEYGLSVPNAFSWRTEGNGTAGEAITLPPKMVFTNTGFLGVGQTPDTTYGGYVLQVNGGSQSYVHFHNDTHSGNVLNGFSIGNDGTSANLIQRENQPIRFYTNDIVRGEFNAAGNFYFYEDIRNNGQAVGLDILNIRGRSNGQYIRLMGGENGFGIVDSGWSSTVHIRNMNSYGHIYHNGGQEIWIGNGTDQPLKLTGQLKLGVFSQSQTNTGDAWFGRAGDRAAGSATIQLGTNTSSKFEIVDYAWSKVLFEVIDSGRGFFQGEVWASSFRDQNGTYHVTPNSTSQIRNLELRANANFDIYDSTNASFIHCDARSEGDFSAAYKYSWKTGGGYGYYREYWWDGNSYQSIAQIDDSFRFSCKMAVNQTTAPSYELDVTGTIRATSDIIAFSDARVKENVKTIDNALDKVTQLRGVSYNKIGETEEKIGVIAQEIEKVLPQVVQEDAEGMKSVAYGNIVGVLIEAIKEQQKQIDELKAQING